jgi:hypothetical protein
MSILITQKDITTFAKDYFGIHDPLFCLWKTKEAPEPVMYEESYYLNNEVYNIDTNTVLFLKEDIQSMFFVSNTKPQDWNLVLVCLNYIDNPILGWIFVPEKSNHTDCLD